MDMDDVIHTYTHTHTHTHTHTGILFSNKKKEILPFATTWMDLESIMLREISQTEKDKYCMISLICGINKHTNKLIDTEHKMVVARSWGLV